MKIEYAQKKGKRISDIKLGECFRYKNKLYLKLPTVMDDETYWNTFNFSDDCVEGIGRDERVDPVDVHIVVE